MTRYRYWSRSRVFRGLVALVVVSVVGVAAAEAYFRFAHYEVLKNMSYPLLYEPDALLGYRYTPGAESRICQPSICKDVRVNENGYFGPSFTREPAPGVFRIAIVDSSQATGLWMDGTQSFAIQLQGLLDEAGHHSEVLNFSIDGLLLTVFR